MGNLRSSKIRSLYWRILLGVIPLESSEWLTSVRNLRKRYDDTKHRFTLDPHKSSNVADDNPLSQHENVSS